MYKFKLTEIELSNGEKFGPTNLTVVVGPNNVGKSRFLKDLVRCVANLGPAPILVNSIQTTIPASYSSLIESYTHVKRRKVAPQQDLRSVWLAPNMCSGGGHSCPQHQYEQQLQQSLNPENKKLNNSRQSFLLSHFGGGLVAHLTTEHRLSLLNPFNTAQGNQGHRMHLTQALYNSPVLAETRIKHRKAGIWEGSGTRFF